MASINETVLAIRAQGVSRHYGKGKKKVPVLDHISMSLPRGFD
jgi:hypothetical protein